MTNWQTLQPKYERKAYRIVQKHIKSILSGIPYSNASLGTYEWLIEGNITYEQVHAMFKELYTVIGLDYGNRINKDLEKVKKANVLFNEYLLREILLFLSSEGGVKITSVRETLIADIIKSIKETLGINGTVIDLQNAIYNLIRKSQTFYKWQALRIARTETTSASGLSALKTAENSDLEMSKSWISVLDNRTRLDHKIEDGQSVDLDKPFIMASGAKLDYPGDTKAPANEVINCRCTIAFIPKRDANGMLIFKN
jgi:hypothetical protein